MFSARARFIASLPPIVLVSLALRPVFDAPHLAPKEGTVVKRTLEMKGTRELTKLTVHAGEQSQDVDGAKLHVDMSWKYVTKDELQKCSKGEITKLARTYESLDKQRVETSKDKQGDDQTNESPETSDLAGKTVVFTWDADKKEYTKKFDGDGDAKLTENLELDMDYSALLPESGAEAGAKWEVDFADAKLALLRPGGDFSFHGKKETPAMQERLRTAAWDSTKGKVALELGKTTEEEGRKLVTIKFKGNLGGDAETEREGDEKGPSKLRVEDSEDLEGELVWDLTAGRARGIEWSTKGAMKLTLTITGKAKDGDEMTLEQIFEFDEEYAYTGRFEVQ